MRWYEYKTEVDDLHASDDLKAKLLAMQTQAAPKAAPAAPAPRRKKAIRFPTRQLAGLAACLALCAAGSSLLFGTKSSIPLMGASSADSAAVVSRAAAGALPEAVSFSMENGITALSAQEAATGRSREAESAKIIYTARLTLESKNYDAARAALDSALLEAGGYLESSDESTAPGVCRSLSLTLRVPQESYQSFLEDAARAGNLVSKSEQAEDVTSQYLDLEARLANLTAQRARLLELQASADTLSDLLEIESSLSEVQYQLESYQSQLDWYSQQIECCTVRIALEEVEVYTPVQDGFGSRLAEAFRSGWSNFVAGAQQLAVFAVMAWPVLVLAAAVLCVVFGLRRKHRK